MGRKIDMKKIEDITKCQVTFSKRRSSLMKKANEIAVCCDVDVAFVAFSPSGRISKFCNQKRIEDVLHRYVNLPADKRLNNINNVQGKMEKLRQLGHIKGDSSKLQYLDKQIENLELQIKKSGLELQILETGLRDYELDPEQDPSLHQLSWCERNLNHSLQRVNARKNALLGNSSTALNKQPSFQMEQMESESQAGNPLSSNFNQNDQVSTIEDPSSRSQVLMQLDPWISPYSAKVRENIFRELLDQAKYTTTNKNPMPSNLPSFSIPSNICKFPFPDSPAIFASESMDTQNPTPHFSVENSLSVEQTLLNLRDQNNVNAWNNLSSVNFPNAINISNQSSCNIQGPRLASITRLNCTNSNLSKLDMGGQEIGQVNMDSNNSFSNGNTLNDNGDDENCYKIACNEMHTSDQSQASYDHSDPQKEVRHEIPFDNLPQDALGDNRHLTPKIQTNSLWEWEDLLLDENFNL